MISLGAISRDIMFRDGAADVLTAHSTFTWNKAETRIRCNGNSCGEILEVPGGPDGDEVVAVFARHQADMLPALPEPEPEAVPDNRDDPEPETNEAEAIAEDTENEPAGEALETDVADKPAKTRRDTKALQATIAEIKKGDRVTAFFKHPRYGEFAVEGTVIQGGAGLERNQLMVGGWYLNINDRAAKHLQELIIVATAGNHEFAIPKPSEATEHVGIGA